MDESLEEVALLGRAQARHASSNASWASKYAPARAEPSPRWYSVRDGGIVALRHGNDPARGVDLFFRGKLEGLLPEHRFTTPTGSTRPIS